MINRQGEGRVYSVGTVDKGKVHVSGGTWFYHATQNGMWFKIYELFISGIFHLIFLDLNWLQVTEIAESKIMGKEGLLYVMFVCIYLFIIPVL